MEGVVVHEREELYDTLQKTLADKEIGIILLTEKFGKEFPDILEDVRLNHKLPLLIEIPDRHAVEPLHPVGHHFLYIKGPLDFITSFVNESIGLKL